MASPGEFGAPNALPLPLLLLLLLLFSVFARSICGNWYCARLRWAALRSGGRGIEAVEVSGGELSRREVMRLSSTGRILWGMLRVLFGECSELKLFSNEKFGALVCAHM